MIEHAEINFALIRERANEGDRRRSDGQVAARMRVPWRFRGLGLIDAVGDGYVGTAFDESPDADRELGLAVLAPHQQMALAVARLQRRRDQGAVVEGGFFIVDDPRRTARLAFRRPARSARGRIKTVVAFQSLAIVLDLTARPEGVLGLSASGKSNAGASDDQYGAHGSYQSRSCRSMQDRSGMITSRRPHERERCAPDQEAKEEDQRLSVLATRKPSVSNRKRLTRTAARTSSPSLRQEPPRTTRKLASPSRSDADPSVGAPS